MKLEDFYATLEDYSWKLVNMLGLSGFFEEYNIPPILLPIGIFTIIICIFLLTAPLGGVPQNVKSTCGDGFCDSFGGENKGTCPIDCDKKTPATKTAKKVRVQFDKDPDCGLYVSLYTTDTAPPLRKYALEKETIFANIEAESAHVLVEGPLGEVYESKKPQDLIEGDNTIDVILPDTICGVASSQQGVLSVIIKDYDTKSLLNGVKVSVAEAINGKATNYQYTGSIVTGEKDFTVPPNRDYILFAEKTGYSDYNGLSSPINVPVGRPATKSISMKLLPEGEETLSGSLTVCLKNGTQPLLSGLINLKSVSGETLASGNISESGNGCFLFRDIDAGKTIIATLADPPKGCLSSSSPQITITEAGTDSIVLPVNCPSGDLAYLRVRALDELGAVITQNATITVWDDYDLPIPGHASDGSLLLGDFDYTEEIAVPSDVLIYVVAQPTTALYLQNQTEPFTLAPGEYKALDIRLLNAPEMVLNTSSEVPISEEVLDPETGDIGSEGYAPSGELLEPELTLSGLSTPAEVPAERIFVASLGEVYSGQTQLTSEMVNVTAKVDDTLCNLTYVGTWTAKCKAPKSTGAHKIIFTAKAGSKTATEEKSINIIKYSDAGIVSIVSIPPTRGDSPVELTYEITMDGEPVEALASQKATISYQDAPNAYAGSVGQLTSLGDGYWTLLADALLKGEYDLTIDLEVLKDDIYYSSKQFSTFTSNSVSPNLEIDANIVTKVLGTGEDFTLEVFPLYTGAGETPIFPKGLEFWVYLNRGYTKLSEKDNSYKYTATLTAPPIKTCTLPLRLALYNTLIDITNSEGSSSTDVQLSVIDITGPKSYTCPLDTQGLSSCDSIDEMRKCVYDYKADMHMYTESSIMSCISSACYGEIPLACPGDNLGDLDGDCRMTEKDTSMAQSILKDLPSQADDFEDCADIDYDGKFTEKDITCIKNVAGGKWIGEIGTGIFENEGACRDDMDGAFCFDIDTSSILPGDLNGNEKLDVGDWDTLEKIIEVIDRTGIQPTEKIMTVADFDRNEILDGQDIKCLKDLSLAVDFEAGQVKTSLESGISSINPRCLNIFEMDCLGVKGDLNGDGIIDNDDYLLLSMITKGIFQINELPTDMKKCADVNGDGSVTEGDIICINHFLSDEDEEEWMLCLGCDEGLPRLAYGLEICDDGYDNDCNGKIDLVKGIEEEVCKCEEGKTPCWTKKDLDGGVKPGIKDGNFAYCRHISWDVGDEATQGASAGGFQWYEHTKLNCTQDLNCRTMECNETSGTYLCSMSIENVDTHCAKLNQIWKDKQIFATYYCYDGSVPGSETPFALGWYPQEQSGDGVAKLPSINELCEDDWDNDCIDGDEHCPSFWKKLLKNPWNIIILIVLLVIAVIICIVSIGTMCAQALGGWWGAAALIVDVTVAYTWERANSYSPGTNVKTSNMPPDAVLV